MSTSAERQAAFRRRMEADGYVQVTGWVPSNTASDIMEVMRRLRENSNLEVACFRDTLTGRMVRK